MANFKEQLQKVTQDIHLSAAEKSALRERLSMYMEHKPLRQEMRSIPSSFNVFTLSYIRLAVPAALMAVVFVSGGVSYAAEGAVPGDTLYPVKIRVNEEVRTALTFGEEEKLAWNIRRAERRLEEASTLAAEGSLTDENQEVLASQFEVHATDVATEVAAVTERNPALALEINSQFEASLMAHGEVIDQVAGTDALVRAEASKLLARVEAKRMELSDRLAVADGTALSFSVAAGSMETMSVRMKGVPEEAPSGAGATAQEDTFSTMSLEQSADAPVDMQMNVSESQPEDRSSDLSVEHKEAAQRMSKLLAAKIESATELFESSKDVLSEEEREEVADLIANLKMHVQTAEDRAGEGEYTEAFRKLRALLLTALRLEVYLRAIGELGLKNATIPALPFGFPEFDQPSSSHEELSSPPEEEEAVEKPEDSVPDHEPTSSTDLDRPIRVDTNVNVDLDL